jgi:hypothetical protein
MTETAQRPERRVLLLTLSERTSARGTVYLSGWLGKARLVGFKAKEPDKYGNEQWEIYACEPREEPDHRDPPTPGQQTHEAARERAESWSKADRERYVAGLAAELDRRGPDEEPF